MVATADMEIMENVKNNRRIVYFMEKSVINSDISRVKPSNSYLLIKRIFDICISLVGMIVLAIVTIIIAIFYSFGKNKGKIFFTQERIGLHGKRFKIYKFRSMVENAQEILMKNEELYQKYLDNSYKLLPEEDPRMTRLGRFIRKHSIDEIPQFINILKGDMSFIGPRPIVKEELFEYGDRAIKFLSVKPGATGWWQVSGRSSIGYPERCDVELYYVENRSLKLDMKIFFMELKRIVMRDSAY